MTATKTKRDQILALQQDMVEDQTAAMKELLEFFGGDEIKGLVEKLQELRNRMIPNTTMDHQIAGFINQLAQLGQTTGQVYQQAVAQG